jgi:hypothetical protein
MHKGIISAIKKVEYVSDTMSYLTQRGCGCDIIILNVYAWSEDRCDDTKDKFMRS